MLLLFVLNDLYSVLRLKYENSNPVLLLFVLNDLYSVQRFKYENSNPLLLLFVLNDLYSVLRLKYENSNPVLLLFVLNDLYSVQRLKYENSNPVLYLLNKQKFLPRVRFWTFYSDNEQFSWDWSCNSWFSPTPSSSKQTPLLGYSPPPSRKPFKTLSPPFE